VVFAIIARARAPVERTRAQGKTVWLTCRSRLQLLFISCAAEIDDEATAFRIDHDLLWVFSYTL